MHGEKEWSCCRRRAAAAADEDDCEEELFLPDLRRRMNSHRHRPDVSFVAVVVRDYGDDEDEDEDSMYCPPSCSLELVTRFDHL